MAGIGTTTPFLGLRPIRSPLDRTTKLPKPDSFTGSPLASAAAISCKTISTRSTDSLRVPPTFR